LWLKLGKKYTTKRKNKNFGKKMEILKFQTLVKNRNVDKRSKFWLEFKVWSKNEIWLKNRNFG